MKSNQNESKKPDILPNSKAPLHIAKSFFEGHKYAWSMLLNYKDINGVGATAIKKLMGIPGVVLDYSEHLDNERTAQNPNAFRDAGIRTTIDSVFRNPLVSLLILNGKISENELESMSSPKFNINSDDPWEREFAGWEQNDFDGHKQNAAVGKFLDELSTKLSDVIISKWNSVSGSIHNYLSSISPSLETDIQNKKFNNLDDALLASGIKDHLNKINFETPNQRLLYGLALRESFQKKYSSKSEKKIKNEPLHIYVKMDSLLDELIQLEDEMIQLEKETLITSHKNTVLSPNEYQKVNDFLRENHLSEKLSGNKNEDQILHSALHQIITDLEQQKEHQNAMNRISKAYSLLGVIGIFGRIFNNKDIQEFAFAGMNTYTIALNIPEIMNLFSSSLEFTSLNPVMAVLNAGINIYSTFFNEDVDRLNEQRLAEFQAVQSMFQSLYRALIEYAEYSHQRFNRIDRYAFHYHSQTMQTLKQMNEFFTSGLQYLQIRMEHNFQKIKPELKVILTIGQENLLEKLDESESIIDRKNTITASEFAKVIDVAEFYLHRQAANSAFTFSPLTTMNKQVTADDFTLNEIEANLLNQNPFNRLGYIREYFNYLMKKQDNTPIANPYVYLRALDVLIKANLKYPEYARYYDAQELKKLIAPAETIIELCNTTRNQLTIAHSTYESAKSNMITFIMDKLKDFNANNTALAIDIHSNMTDLEKKYKFSKDSHPVESKMHHYRVGMKGDQFMVAPWTLVRAKFEIDVGSLYNEMLALDYTIPFEYLVAEKINLFKNQISFDIPYDYPSYPVRHFKYVINFYHTYELEPDIHLNYLSCVRELNRGTNELPLVIYDISSKRHDLMEHSKNQNTPRMRDYYASASLSSCSPTEESKNDSKEIYQQLDNTIFVNARKNFAKKFIDPLSPEFNRFNKLKDNLDHAYIMYLTTLSFSFANFNITSNISQALYNGDKVQNAINTEYNNADLSELDYIIEKQDQPQYDSFKSKVLEQVRLITNNTSNNYHPIESAIRTAISYFRSLNDLGLLQRNKNNQSKTTYPATTVSSTLLEVASRCDDEKISIAIEDAPDLDITINGETALDKAYQCKNARKRNRILKELIENNARKCKNPKAIAAVLEELCNKSKDILSEKEFTRLNKSYLRFLNYHQIGSTVKIEKNKQPIKQQKQPSINEDEVIDLDDVIQVKVQESSNPFGAYAAELPPLREPLYVEVQNNIEHIEIDTKLQLYMTDNSRIPEVKKEKRNEFIIDYNQFIYKSEDQTYVQPIFVSLLKSSCSPELIDYGKPMSLHDFVTITQKPDTGWMRKANQSRWDIDTSSTNGVVENKIDKIIKNMNLFQQQPLLEKQYDAVVMLGSSIPNLAIRFFHLVDLLKTKHFNRIFLMGSNDDVTSFKGSLETIVKMFPDKFKEGFIIPDKLTEQGVMEFFIENLKGLARIKSNEIIKLISLVKINPDGKFVKPNTHDELKKLNEFLNRDDSTSTSIAIISHAPFYYRQHLVFLSMAGKYQIETTAPDGQAFPELNKISGSVINQKTCLDEIARLFYQLLQFSKEKPEIMLHMLDKKPKQVLGEGIELWRRTNSRYMNLDQEQYSQQLSQAAKELNLAGRIEASLERMNRLSQPHIIIDRWEPTIEDAERLEASFPPCDDSYRASKEVLDWAQALIKEDLSEHNSPDLINKTEPAEISWSSWAYNKITGLFSSSPASLPTNDAQTLVKETNESKTTHGHGTDHCTFLQPQSFNDKLVALQFICSTYLNPLFFWNIKQKLTLKSRTCLEEQNIELSKLEKKFQDKKDSRSYRFGVHHDLFKDTERAINQAKLLINQALISGNISSSEASNIDKYMDQITNWLPKLTDNRKAHAARQEIRKNKIKERRHPGREKSAQSLNGISLFSNATLQQSLQPLVDSQHGTSIASGHMPKQLRG